LEGRGFYHRLYPNFKRRILPLTNVKDGTPEHRASQIEVVAGQWNYLPVKRRYEESKGQATRPEVRELPWI
jgi:hypothetical protein